MIQSRRLVPSAFNPASAKSLSMESATSPHGERSGRWRSVWGGMLAGYESAAALGQYTRVIEQVAMTPRPWPGGAEINCAPHACVGI